MLEVREYSASRTKTVRYEFALIDHRCSIPQRQVTGTVKNEYNLKKDGSV